MVPSRPPYMPPDAYIQAQEQADMHMSRVLRGALIAGFASAIFACSNDNREPTSPLVANLSSGSGEDNSGSGSASRVRCERRTYPNRSQIEVDGRNLVPLNGLFRARVQAAGGTVTSAAARANGDQLRFEFDSDRDKIAAGATAIAATFVARRTGPDVIGEILNAQGTVVFRQAVECVFQ